MIDLTFIIPVYNIKGTRYRNFKFVLSKIPNEYNIIVVEQIKNNKTTNIKKYCDENNIKYISIIIDDNIIHKSSLINKGVKCSTSKYIWMHDGDCLFKYNKVINQLKMINNVDCIMPYNICKRISNKESNQLVRGEKIHVNINKNSISADNHISLLGAGGIIFDRQFFDSLGGYDEKIIGYGFEDHDIAYRIIKRQKSNIIFMDIMAIHLWHPSKNINHHNIEYIEDKHNKNMANIVSIIDHAQYNIKKKVYIAVIGYGGYKKYLQKRCTEIESVNCCKILLDNGLQLTDKQKKDLHDWVIIEQSNILSANQARNICLDYIFKLNHKITYNIINAWIIFWDLDNKFTKKYYNSIIKNIDNNYDDNICAFYPDIYQQHAKKFINTPEWDFWDIRKQSVVENASLWNVYALLQVSGFNTSITPPSMHIIDDYDIIIKLSRLGWVAKKSKNTVLVYNDHAKKGRLSLTPPYLDTTYSLTVITMFRGDCMLLDNIYNWLKRQSLPDDTLIKWVVNTSDNKFINEAYSRAREFKNIHIIQTDTKFNITDNYFDNRHESIGKLYGEHISNCTTDLILLLEDDIIPPDNAFNKLIKHIKPWNNIGGISGVYEGRDIRNSVCGVLTKEIDNSKRPSIDRIFNTGYHEAERIPGGFTLWNNWAIKQCLPIKYIRPCNKKIEGWDWYLSRIARKQNINIGIDSNVFCRHII